MQRMRRVYMRLAACVSFMLCVPLWLPTADAQQQQQPQQPQQQGSRATYVFRATVEKVDANAKKLTVNKMDAKLKTPEGVSGQGWSMAMSQTYGVDKPEVLSRLKAGDQITATVHEGDIETLHDVQVEPPSRNTSDSAQR